MFETCDAFNHYNPSVAAPSLLLPLLLPLTFRSCASNDNDFQGIQCVCVPHLRSSIGTPGVA